MILTFAYILTFVGILSASYGAGDTLTMALTRTPQMKNLRRNNALMGIGAIVALVGTIIVLNTEHVTTLGIQ